MKKKFIKKNNKQMTNKIIENKKCCCNHSARSHISYLNGLLVWSSCNKCDCVFFRKEK